MLWIAFAVKYGKDDNAVVFIYKENLIWTSAQESSADILMERRVEQRISENSVEGGVQIKDKV